MGGPASWVAARRRGNKNNGNGEEDDNVNTNTNETNAPYITNYQSMMMLSDDDEPQPQQQEERNNGNNIGADPPSAADPLANAPFSPASYEDTTTDDTYDNDDFRGFSTSINDLFRFGTLVERVDCCALTCCGVLQNDRDRYLLTGVSPPSLLKRLILHVFLPLTLFFIAGMGAMRIRHVRLNQIFCTTLIALLVIYLFLQCSKGRAKRMEIRKDLLYVKYQLQQLQKQQQRGGRRGSNKSNANNNGIADVLEHCERPYEAEDDDDDDEERAYLTALGQTRNDIRCAHPRYCLIGCYANDRNSRNNSNSIERDADNDNVCSCLYDMACPSSYCCGMYPQLCGLCAIGQEAREIELQLIPERYRRLDYITMEPWTRYYPAVYQHKHYGLEQLQQQQDHGGEGGDADAAAAAAEGEQSNQNKKSNDGRSGTVLGHPLSLLSTRLLQSLAVSCAVLLVWSIFAPLYWARVTGQAKRHSFGVLDFVLLLCTFAQSFAILAVWRFCIHRYNNNNNTQSASRLLLLSMDAIVKYYASGFFLASSLALFWELLAAFVVRTMVSLLLAIAGVDVMNDPESDSTLLHHPNEMAMPIMTTSSTTATATSRIHTSASAGAHGHHHHPHHHNHHHYLASIGVSRTDYQQVFGYDHPVFYVFYIFIATFVVAAFIEELCKYFSYRMVEHPDFLPKAALEEATTLHHYHRRRRGGGANQSHPDEDDDDDAYEEEEGGDDAETPESPSHRDPASTTPVVDYAKQLDSIQAQGAASKLFETRGRHVEILMRLTSSLLLFLF